jgi:hypothetical protein
MIFMVLPAFYSGSSDQSKQQGYDGQDDQYMYQAGSTVYKETQ